MATWSSPIPTALPMLPASGRGCPRTRPAIADNHEVLTDVAEPCRWVLRGSLRLDAGRDAGGAPGRRSNRVVPGGPRDLPVVALGIGEVRVAALEELRVRRFLRHGGTGLAGVP